MVRPHRPSTAAAMMAAPAMPVTLSRSPEQDGREDGTGQGLEQAQQGGRAGGGGPQAAEVQRVGHGGRAGTQRDQQADGREAWPEADAARQLSQLGVGLLAGRRW